MRVRTNDPTTQKAYTAHHRLWANCTACPLSVNRCRHVDYSGNLPCDILFVGEGPGESENALGLPFIGPAGSYLREVLYELLISSKELAASTIGYCNIVACVPRSEVDGESYRAPTSVEATACRPRLDHLIDNFARPKLIIRVGKSAQRYLSGDYRGSDHRRLDGSEVPYRDIVHPSWVLRQAEHMQAYAQSRLECDLRQALSVLGEVE